MCIKKLIRKITGIEKKDMLINMLLKKLDKSETEIRVLKSVINAYAKRGIYEKNWFRGNYWR